MYNLEQRIGGDPDLSPGGKEVRHSSFLNMAALSIAKNLLRLISMVLVLNPLIPFILISVRAKTCRVYEQAEHTEP